jgi:hypothetical protein
MSGKNTYQPISSYDGTLYGQPRYQGIEYNAQIADDTVIGSPGGVDSVMHHYTGGMWGRGNSSADIYAGQQQRYISGVYGNLYQTGHGAADFLAMYPRPPDYPYWKMDEPQQYSYSNSEEAMWAPVMKTYDQPGAYQDYPLANNPQSLPPSDTYGHPLEKKSSAVEGYESVDSSKESYSKDDSGSKDDSFELVEPSDEVEETFDREKFSQNSDDRICFPVKPWVLLLILILAFVAFSLWSEAGVLFINQMWYRGASPSWQRSIIHAVVATVVLVVILWMTGVTG